MARAAWILARSGANMSSVILPSSLPFCGCFLSLATGHRQGRAAIGATGAMSWPSQHSLRCCDTAAVNRPRNISAFLTLAVQSTRACMSVNRGAPVIARVGSLSRPRMRLSTAVYSCRILLLVVHPTDPYSPHPRNSEGNRSKSPYCFLRAYALQLYSCTCIRIINHKFNACAQWVGRMYY